MSHLYRKCTKCGRSPKFVPGVKLNRFPKPGPKNAIRCESWAKFCFPDSNWSSPTFQLQLFHDNRMLCKEDQALALQAFLGTSSSEPTTSSSQEPGSSQVNKQEEDKYEYLAQLLNRDPGQRPLPLLQDTTIT